MNKKIVKLFIGMFLSVMHVHVTSLSAMTEDHAAEMPLVGKLTMHYLKTTSHDENKPVTVMHPKN